ncbi:MAG: acyl-CoA synthetase FdrA [Alkalispirochaeta sp.]
MKRIILRKDSYYDSVFLMLISSNIKKMKGISEAVVAMGTEMNVDLLNDMGMGGPELKGATANDLIIAVEAADKQTIEAAETTVDEKLREKADDSSASGWRPGSAAAAYEAVPDSNMVIVAVPGQYAAREVRKALQADKHVMLFSDNVSPEDEVALKKLAKQRGLLMMGADCGTAIINGKPLCFANVVPRGPVGIISAAGTGLQEVSTLVARAGSGVSQGIGTGGRDLKSEDVGGITTLMAAEALAADPQTKVITVISKPPAPSVADKVIAALKKAGKPVVVHLIGRTIEKSVDGNINYAHNLEEAARMAVALAAGENYHSRVFDVDDDAIDAIVERETEGISSQQKYLRGYFTGGTLTDEAVFLLDAQLGGIHSLEPVDPANQLKDPHRSQEHTVVDLGEDVFTVGRPHPMIDPSIRTERMDKESNDAEIAVVLLDCVIGYSSHPDPAGAMVPAIKRMKAAAEKRGGYLAVVAGVTGTEGDFQNLSAQRQTLESAGVVVMPSNHQAVQFVGRVMAKLAAR